MRAAILAAVLFCLASPAWAAHARHHHVHYHHRHHVIRIAHHEAQFDKIGDAILKVARQAMERPADCYGIPWCGCYMRHLMGVADRAYNLAANWAHYGTAASGPCVGCIVVWPHHVGILVGQSEGRWVVRSGNDGHAVRTRARSIAGAIAFRYTPHHGDWGAF